MLPKCKWSCSIRNDQNEQERQKGGKEGKKIYPHLASSNKLLSGLAPKCYGVNQLAERRQLHSVDQPEFLQGKKRVTLICLDNICTAFFSDEDFQ
jgi:hypothetical protein